MLIYKILLPAEWAEFEAAGRFDGSPLDRSSGYIHLSDRDQVGPVALGLFGDEPDLVVIAVDAAAVEETLRWEASDGGVFPHVYGSLPRAAVVAVHRIDGAELADGVLPRE